MDAENVILLTTSPAPALSTATETAKILAGFFADIRSPLTLREYRLAVTELFTFLGSEVSYPSELRKHHITFYKRHLETKGLANKTIQKKMSAVSAFCRHLGAEGLIDRDIIYGIKRPKTQNLRETSDISDTDVRRIFAAIEPKKFNSDAYRAILAVGFFTGLRSAEIRRLRMKNVGQVDGIKLLHMTIKGDKPHEIPLHPFVIKALTLHMERMKEMGFPTTDPDHVLFPSLKTKANRPMSNEALCYIFRTCLKKAGIEKSDFRRYSPHSMRATFAGHLLNTIEAPLEDVQAAMGHANPSTTQKYNKRRKALEKSPVYRIDY